MLADLPGHRKNAIEQHELGEATKAPMIKPSFGELSFRDADALEVKTRFNALHGSNTQPRA